jgi:hypothetical protein
MKEYHDKEAVNQLVEKLHDWLEAGMHRGRPGVKLNHELIILSENYELKLRLLS